MGRAASECESRYAKVKVLLERRYISPERKVRGQRDLPRRIRRSVAAGGLRPAVFAGPHDTTAAADERLRGSRCAIGGRCVGEAAMDVLGELTDADPGSERSE